MPKELTMIIQALFRIDGKGNKRMILIEGEDAWDMTAREIRKTVQDALSAEELKNYHLDGFNVLLKT